MWRYERLRRRRDDGQGLVEFALVVPLLLLLIIGLFEFAAAWRGYQVVTDAAREVTRVAVVDGDEAWADVPALLAIAEQALARGGLNPNAAGVDIFIDGCDKCPNTDDYSTVRITYPYGFVVLGRLAGLPPVTLRTNTVMRNEYAAGSP